MQKAWVARSTSICSALLGTAAFMGLAGGIDAQEKPSPDKRDSQAKEVAEQFMSAVLKAEGIEAVMRNVDVPFFFGDRDNVKDREQLKQIIEKTLDPAAAEV